MSYLYKIPVISDNGINYERRAVARLRAHGFDVRWSPCHKSNAVDAVLVGANKEVTLEIKGSRLRKISTRGIGYQFVLERRGYSAPIQEDFCVLLCRAHFRRNDCLFIVPSYVVHRAPPTLSITSADPRAYNGFYAVYRENYDLLRDALED